MRIKGLMIILMMFALSVVAVAQETQEVQAIAQELQEEVLPQYRKNAVKFNPIDLAFGSMSFTYERMISPKNSLNLTVGIPNGLELGERILEELASDEYSISSASLDNLHLRAAYRHYTGKKSGPRGFYLEPSLKYQTLNPNMAGNATIEVTDNVTGQQVEESGFVSADATISSFTAGFQMGYQFLIAKRVTLDLGFFGLEAGTGKVNVTAYSDNADIVGEFKQDIIDAIENLPFGNPTATVEGNTIKAKTESVFFPMLRFNIGIGIAF